MTTFQYIIFFFFVFVLSMTPLPVSQAKCIAGQYLSTKSKCLKCRKGTFRDADNHSNLPCHLCTPCNTINMYEAVKCHHTSDTICCPGPAMIVEKNNGVNDCSQPSTNRSYCCVEKTKTATKYLVSGPLSKDEMLKLISTSPENFVCQRGTYLQKDQAKSILSCLPCPLGTFMSHDNHKFTSCQPCTQPERFNHEVMVKKCTSTHDTVIGCSEHYYRVERKFRDFNEGECQRCTDCTAHGLYVAQACDDQTDTVCCPKLGMTIQIDQHGKYQCK